MRKTFPLAVLLTVFLLIFLRFFKLGEIPQGLNIDEASYGYDAYSIMKTGKDQWGNQLPLTLKSFNDYKPAGLSYTIIPAIKVFGLNTTSVRFPSAFFGLLTLPILYLTLKRLQDNKYLNLLLVVIYAVSPWAYGISRTFYEPNVGLFFVASAIFLFIKSYQDKNIKSSTQAFAILAISGYFYAALRYVVLIIIAVFVAVWNLDRKKIAYFTKQFLLFGLIMLPLLPIMFSSVGLKRLNQEKQLLTYGYELVVNESRQMCFLVSENNPNFTKLCYLLWNKPVQNLTTTFDAWGTHLSPEYLFFSSSHPDILPQEQGAYFSWLLPFYFIGIVILSLNSFKKSKIHTFLFLTMLISPLPAALAQATRIHRNVVGLYLVYLCISMGIQATYKYVRNRYSSLYHLVLFSALVLIATFAGTKYITHYHTLYTHTQPEVWNYDSREIYDFIIKNQSNYGHIIDTVFVDGPLYFAFYNQTDPAYFQTNIIRRAPNEKDWIHNDRLGPIQNGGPAVRELLCAKNANPSVKVSTLIITSPINSFSEYSILQTKSFDQTHILHEIYDIDSLYSNLLKENYNLTSLCNLEISI